MTDRPGVAVNAIRAFVAIGLVAVCGALFAAPAQAQTCSNGPQSRFIGYYHDVSTPYDFEGASTYLTGRPVTLCSGDNSGGTNFSNSWAMIGSASSQAGQNQYAQAGFEVRKDLVSTRHFSQINSGTGVVQTKYSSTVIPNGERHAYRALYNAACHCVVTSVDSVTYLMSGFNPFGTWQFPLMPQFMGEVSYLNQDMPGTPADKTHFTGLGAQRYDDVVISMPCTMLPVNQNSTLWGRSASSCIAFDIWTK